MKDTQLIMGMPITVEIADKDADKNALELAFNYFKYIDEEFSTYKETSEISLINQGKLKLEDSSIEMQEIFKLAAETKKETDSYFDIKKLDGLYDPSGIVKGWAIHNASLLLKKSGYKNFCIEAGGDIETSGVNDQDKGWKIGIKNPFNPAEIVKVLEIQNKGIATSGTYIRGNHIYNPKDKNAKIEEIVSLSVIGPNIYEADRFATAAFAMGRDGILFIEKLNGFEGYMIDKNGIATMTSGFEKYVKNN